MTKKDIQSLKQAKIEQMHAELEPAITNEQLLARINSLLQSKPDQQTYANDKYNEEVISWNSDVEATLQHWDKVRAIKLSAAHSNLAMNYGDEAYRQLLSLLYEARHDLQIKSKTPSSVAIEAGKVFDYFEGLKELIKMASNDLLFVDPYLSDEFISRFMGFVQDGVKVRLLTREKIKILLPAVNAYKTQYNVDIEVRVINNFHDRYLLIDGKECHQSGTSFDAGGKKPTTITQIIDAFPAVKQTYENMWNKAKVV